MRLLILVVLALLAAVLVPLIAHSEGLSWIGTGDARWGEGGRHVAVERHATAGGFEPAPCAPGHPHGS